MTQKYQVKVSMKQAAIVETGIVLKQGDFGMQIEIEVLDFDATGTTPQIVFRKAMGAVESTTITVSSNKYTYTFKGTELDTPGKVFCDLKLKNSTTQRISTASFMFRVIADTMDGLNEQSSSYSDTIAQIVGGFDGDISSIKNGISNAANNTLESNKIYSPIYDIVFEKGSLSDYGQPSTNPNRGRTRDFLTFKSGHVKIECPEEYAVLVFVYNSGHTFISAFSYVYGSGILTTSENYCYKFMIRDTTNSDYDTWKDDFLAKFQLLTFIENDTISKSVPLQIEKGALNESTGEPSGNDYRTRDIDFYEIGNDGLSIYIESGYKVIIYCYDSTYAFINKLTYVSTPGIYNPTLPQGTKYIKRVIGTTDNANAAYGFDYGARIIEKAKSSIYTDQLISQCNQRIDETNNDINKTKKTINAASIKQLQTNNIYMPNYDIVFEKGALSDSGQPSTNPNRARTTDYLSFPDGHIQIECPDDYAFAVFLYDNSKTFKAGFAYYYGSMVMPVSSGYYYKFMIRDLTNTDYDNWKDGFLAKCHFLPFVENDTVRKSISSQIEKGSFDSSGNPSANDVRARDISFYPVENEKMELFIESGYKVEILCYNSSYGFISYIDYVSTPGIYVPALPTGTKYIKRAIGATDNRNAGYDFSYGARLIEKSELALYSDTKNGIILNSAILSGNSKFTHLPDDFMKFGEGSLSSSGEESAYNLRGRTGFLKFDADLICIQKSEDLGFSLFEYNGNKQFIEACEAYNYGQTIYVPVDKTHYYRIMARNTGNDNFSVWKDVANKTEIFYVHLDNASLETIVSVVEKNSLSPTGQPSSNTNRGRDRNFIPVNPGESFFINIKTGYDCAVYCYDSEYQMIGAFDYSNATGVQKYLPPKNTAYIKRMIKNTSNTGFDIGFGFGTEILKKSSLERYADEAAEEASASLPNYEAAEVDRVAGELQSIMNPLSLELAFITDPHCNTTDTNNLSGMRHMVNSIQRLNAITKMDTIINGDNIENKIGDNAKTDFMSECYTFNQILNPLRRIVVKGNHDDNSIAGRTSSTAETVLPGKEISDEEMFIKWWKPIINDGVQIDLENPTGMYGYRDYPTQKIRVICLNNCDVPYMIDLKTGYIKYPAQWVFAYQDEQLQWLCDALKIEAGWAVIISQHVPIELGGSESVINSDIFAGIINAFQAGTHYTASGVVEDFETEIDVDFSTQGAREFICCLAGHTHYDASYTSSGFLTIVSQNALPRGGSREYMIPGTVTENCFDIFSVDRENKTINAVRFGYGGSQANRTFTYN